MNKPEIRITIILLLMVMFNIKGTCQTTMPDVLLRNSLTEQMNYIQEKTRIYENYRAIREDMFQKIKGNALDSLSSAKNRIAELNILAKRLNHTIDSINASFQKTRSELAEATRTKNNIRVFGSEVNKILYNTILWTVIAGLLVILGIGFMAFKRNLAVTNCTRKDIKELKEEFEAYRKSSREAREKMSMDHFNELKKLRGG